MLVVCVSMASTTLLPTIHGISVSVKVFAVIEL